MAGEHGPLLPQLGFTEAMGHCPRTRDRQELVGLQVSTRAVGRGHFEHGRAAVALDHPQRAAGDERGCVVVGVPSLVGVGEYAIGVVAFHDGRDSLAQGQQVPGGPLLRTAQTKRPFSRDTATREGRLGLPPPRTGVCLALVKRPVPWP